MKQLCVQDSGKWSFDLKTKKMSTSFAMKRKRCSWFNPGVGLSFVNLKTKHIKKKKRGGGLSRDNPIVVALRLKITGWYW